MISFPPIFTIHDDYARFNEVYNRAQDLKIGAKTKITYKTIDGNNYAIEAEQPEKARYIEAKVSKMEETWKERSG